MLLKNWSEAPLPVQVHTTIVGCLSPNLSTRLSLATNLWKYFASILLVVQPKTSIPVNNREKVVDSFESQIPVCSHLNFTNLNPSGKLQGLSIWPEHGGVRTPTIWLMEPKPIFLSMLLSRARPPMSHEKVTLRPCKRKDVKTWGPSQQRFLKVFLWW